MAGLMALPSMFDMGGGIDLTKYRYKTVVGRTVQGKGLLIGFTITTDKQKDFTISIDGIKLKDCKTYSYIYMTPVVIIITILVSHYIIIKTIKKDTL